MLRICRVEFFISSVASYVCMYPCVSAVHMYVATFLKENAIVTSSGFISIVPAGSCCVIFHSSNFVPEFAPSKHTRSKSLTTYNAVASGHWQSIVFRHLHF